MSSLRQNRLPSTTRLKIRSGTNATDPRPSHPVFLPLGRRTSPRSRRGCERPAMRHYFGRREHAGRHDLVTVLPVTHSPPGNQTHFIEIPYATKLRLRLDDQRSWIVFSEANRFIWAGPDIRPVPGQISMIYGELPGKLFELTRQRFLTALREQSASLVPRTE
jgi:hypothetical protein